MHVASRKPDEIALHPGKQHAVDAFAVEILPQFGASQSESFVELALGIGEAREIVELIGSEKFCGTVFVAQVNEGDLRAFGFDLSTESGELGDRLAAKSSTKVAEEDQQQRALGGKCRDGLAGL